MRDKHGTKFSTILILTGLLCFVIGSIMSLFFAFIPDISWWFGFILGGLLWIGVSICNFFAILFGI